VQYTSGYIIERNMTPSKGVALPIIFFMALTWERKMGFSHFKHDRSNAIINKEVSTFSYVCGV